MDSPSTERIIIVNEKCVAAWSPHNAALKQFTVSCLYGVSNTDTFLLEEVGKTITNPPVYQSNNLGYFNYCADLIALWLKDTYPNAVLLDAGRHIRDEERLKEGMSLYVPWIQEYNNAT